MMRRFILESGFEVTRQITEGVIFTDGSVAVRWAGDAPGWNLSATWEDCQSVLDGSDVIIHSIGWIEP